MVNSETSAPAPGLEIRSAVGDSFLIQRGDADTVSTADWKVVTKRPPTDAEREALLFGWRVVKHVKSNAIVYAAHDRTLGIGAGQMSRVDSSPHRHLESVRGQAQPHGQRRRLATPSSPSPTASSPPPKPAPPPRSSPAAASSDAEVIAAADERGLAMIFTGQRHFRH